MAAKTEGEVPEGIFSILDTDLYKLTMQCAVLKFFPEVEGGYCFTNRTPQMKFDRRAFDWLQQQITNLANLQVAGEELHWLQQKCPYLSQKYLGYLQSFRFRPSEHVKLTFTPDIGSTPADDPTTKGQIRLDVHGLWLETILYEIPLLALTSEAYFKFIDLDWNHDSQLAYAKKKCSRLLSNDIAFSEFGSRRRRDYRTHDLIMQGIMQAVREADPSWSGSFSGTSNVHFAMKHGCNPVGTVAHEWFMGIAAITQDYKHANEMALKYWVLTYGPGVLGIALTDTFGTKNFLEAFSRPGPTAALSDEELYRMSEPAPKSAKDSSPPSRSYAETFAGVRQDSGNPLRFLEVLKSYYASQDLLLSSPKKTIIYSDSLNVDKCLTYARATIEAGLQPAFGIGTHFTNDFTRASRPEEKSVPLNIVIKLSSAAGHPAVKLSDDAGKNMGASEESIASVKSAVGYEEGGMWEDEGKRWG